MATATRKTSFLDLPNELRNKIYFQALVEPDGDQIPIGHEKCRHDPKSLPEQPALTRTCREIREATLPIYYGANKFEIYIGNEKHLVKEIMPWLGCIGEKNVGFMKHVTFFTFHWSLRANHFCDTCVPEEKIRRYAEAKGLDPAATTVEAIRLMEGFTFLRSERKNIVKVQLVTRYHGQED